MTRVLLTSFEPFGRHTLNSSLEVGRAVARWPPPGVELDWLVLPVVAGACVERAWGRVVEVRPALVLSLGQKDGAARLCVEAAAANLHDFRMRDNASNWFRKQPILPDGPAAYQATAPTDRILLDLHDHQVPAELSLSAGGFICNHLYYGLLHRAAAEGSTHRTCFLHLPLLPEQVPAGRRTPSCGLEQMAEGVRLAIAACVGPGRPS
jgi:pyroglutamyl-peptidase